MSWLVQHELEEGELPPELYLLLHPEAQLSESEKDELVRGLQASLEDAMRPTHRGGGERRERDDD